MTFRTVSLLIAGAVLALGVSCKSNSANANASAAPCKAGCTSTECSAEKKAQCAGKCDMGGAKVNASASMECTGAKECPAQKESCHQAKPQ
jgi:hypothetical protein